jgi:hypothetical protein
MERIAANIPRQLLTHTELYQELLEDRIDPAECNALMGYRLYGLALDGLDVDKLGFAALTYRDALVRFPMTIYVLHFGLDISIQTILLAISACSAPHCVTHIWIDTILDRHVPTIGEFIFELRAAEEHLNDPNAKVPLEQGRYNIASLYPFLRQHPFLLPDLFQLSWWQRDERFGQRGTEPPVEEVMSSGVVASGRVH